VPKSHPPYTPEFRRRMIELVRSGRSPEELSREFEPTAQAISNWGCCGGSPHQPEILRQGSKRT
jgi:transposase-like protein